MNILVVFQSKLDFFLWQLGFSLCFLQTRKRHKESTKKHQEDTKKHGKTPKGHKETPRRHGKDTKKTQKDAMDKTQVLTKNN